MMNLKFGDFPIIMVPVKNLTEGRLIKREGKYYWIQKVNADNSFTGVNAMTGAIESFVPTDSVIPGFNFFTEVVAFDARTLMDPNSKQNMGGNVLGAMLMMKMMDSDKAEFSLDDIDDNSFNGLGMFLPMLLSSKMGNFGFFNNADGTPNIMAMMALMSTNGNGTNDSFMKTYLLSTLISGNNSDNPFGNIMNGFGSLTGTANTGGFVCSTCGKEYSDPSIHFCPECGGRVIASGATCAKCGATLKAGAKFCHVCGTKVGAPTCPKCGKEVSSDAKFCAYCGTNLTETEEPAPTTPDEPASNK